MEILSPCIRCGRMFKEQPHTDDSVCSSCRLAEEVAHERQTDVKTVANIKERDELAKTLVAALLLEEVRKTNFVKDCEKTMEVIAKIAFSQANEYMKAKKNA